MSGSHLSIPRNETVHPPNFQNKIIMFCLPIPTLIYLWEIYIFPGSVCQICGPILGIDKSLTEDECGNWDWGHAIPRKGIHKRDFRCRVQIPLCQHEPLFSPVRTGTFEAILQEHWWKAGFSESIDFQQPLLSPPLDRAGVPEPEFLNFYGA